MHFTLGRTAHNLNMTTEKHTINCTGSVHVTCTHKITTMSATKEIISANYYNNYSYNTAMDGNNMRL